MADATSTRHPSPPGWSEAFAALPLETPTTSRWTAIDAALDGAPADDGNARTRTASTWPRRVAWAAALAAIALPAALWLRPEAGRVPARTPFAATAPVTRSAPDAPIVPPTAAAAPLIADADPVRTPAPPVPATTAHRPAAAVARAPAPTNDAPTPGTKPWPRARVATGHDESESLQAAFEPYYAEAARLERVIAAARDPRVASGPAASLAGALDAELATVDARLAGPGLDDAQRLALWRERVDVLRASAEFESQLRLLAVEGDALDGALVRID